MKIKGSMLLALLFVLFIGTVAYAKTPPEPIFSGQILSIEEDKEQKVTRVLVDGYIKAEKVYREKIVAIVNDETKIHDSEGKKLTAQDLKVGDSVFIVFRPVMTKSLPPQSVAKSIEVCNKK